MEITITEKEIKKTTLSDVYTGTWFKYKTEYGYKRLAIKGSMISDSLVCVMVMMPHCFTGELEADTEIEVIKNSIITIDV